MKREKWNNIVLNTVKDYGQEMPASDEYIEELVKTDESQRMMDRGYTYWKRVELTDGWDRKKTMKYGARCIARGIWMNRAIIR